MKDERKIILKNQVIMEEIMSNPLPYPKINIKPFLVMTIEGDYFFETEEEAKQFATKRNGFFVGKNSRTKRG